MRVFIGMETSGELRRRFIALGHDTISCDILPAEDDGIGHIIGDVMQTLSALHARGWWPDLAVFHPSCTYLTNSAEWAYTDGPYHQEVLPGTLVGAARRAARERDIAEFIKIAKLPILKKIIENPIGVMSTRYREPDQIVQPNWFGDDASKATCFWLWGVKRFRITKKFPPRLVEWPKGSGIMVERWSNQTDSGQNRLSPGEDRWKDRSRTFPGIADAIATQATEPDDDMFSDWRAETVQEAAEKFALVC